MSSVNKGSAKQRISEKIKASHLTTRLQEFAMTFPEDPDYDRKNMTDPQVQAAKILLAKVVPDLKQIEFDGKVVNHVEQVVRTIVDPKPTDS